jgi:5-methylcytosine-specific restriction endonuclease McrA
MKTSEIKNKRLVLVLNRSWMPIQIVNHKDAFRLMCKAHALALDTNMESSDGAYLTRDITQWMDLHLTEHYNRINTPRTEIHIPEIIVLTEYDEMPKRYIMFNKQNLLLRDDYSCGYCGIEVSDSNATIDHIIPQAKGGKNSWENCIIACKQCNSEKADHDPIGKFKPKRKPTEPHHTNPIYHLKQKLRGKMEELPLSWQRALFHKT